MINQIEIDIPYPIKVGFFSINRKKKISFSFDNLALFLFREDMNIDTVEQFQAWQKKHGEFDYLVYVAFFAAKSHAMHNRKKFNLDLKRFAVGLAECGKENIEKLIEVWKRSQNFGSKDLPGSKKKVTKESK